MVVIFSSYTHTSQLRQEQQKKKKSAHQYIYRSSGRLFSTFLSLEPPSHFQTDKSLSPRAQQSSHQRLGACAGVVRAEYREHEHSKRSKVPLSAPWQAKFSGDKNLAECQRAGERAVGVCACVYVCVCPNVGPPDNTLNVHFRESGPDTPTASSS